VLAFHSCEQNTRENNLKGGIIYFGSRFQFIAFGSADSRHLWVRQNLMVKRKLKE
jgi:hypothetical protein